MKSGFNSQNLTDSMVKKLSVLKYYPNNVTESRKILHIINIYRKSRQALGRTDTGYYMCIYKKLLYVFTFKENYQLFQATILFFQTKLRTMTMIGSIKLELSVKTALIDQPICLAIQAWDAPEPKELSSANQHPWEELRLMSWIHEPYTALYPTLISGSASHF